MHACVFVPASLCKHSEHASPSMCADKNTVISYLTPGPIPPAPLFYPQPPPDPLCLTGVKGVGHHVGVNMISISETAALIMSASSA